MKVKDKLAVLKIIAMNNNTIISITRPDGDRGKIAQFSPGASGFTNSKKTYPVSLGETFKIVNKYLIENGYNQLIVEIKGYGMGRDSFKQIDPSIQILSIADYTEEPHNGPKKKSRRSV